MTTFVTYQEIEELHDALEPLIRQSAHTHGLPYIPLIPSLKTYALLETSWEHFSREYKKSVIRAARSGQGYTYID